MANPHIQFERRGAQQQVAVVRITRGAMHCPRARAASLSAVEALCASLASLA